MKVINAIYNFIVGDMVILVGAALTVLVLALINGVGALAPLRGLTGLILVVGVLASLVTTLSREAFSPRREICSTKFQEENTGNTSTG